MSQFLFYQDLIDLKNQLWKKESDVHQIRQELEQLQAQTVKDEMYVLRLVDLKKRLLDEEKEMRRLRRCVKDLEDQALEEEVNALRERSTVKCFQATVNRQRPKSRKQGSQKKRARGTDDTCGPVRRRKRIQITAGLGSSTTTHYVHQQPAQNLNTDLRLHPDSLAGRADTMRESMRRYQDARRESFSFLQQPGHLHPTANGNSANNSMIAGHQEERSSQLDESLFEFSRTQQNVSTGQKKAAADLFVDHGIDALPRGVGSRHERSLSAGKISTLYFGDDDYFKDVSTFFNLPEEQAQLSAIQPTSLPEDEKSRQHFLSHQKRGFKAVNPNVPIAMPARSATNTQMRMGVNVGVNDMQKLRHPPSQQDRMLKNIREKKRRKCVSEKLTELYDLLCANAKSPLQARGNKLVKRRRVSESRILEEAIHLIKTIESEVSTLQSRNSFLEFQLRKLQETPQDKKAASMVTPSILPFPTSSVNPFVCMGMLPMPTNQLPGRR